MASEQEEATVHTWDTKKCDKCGANSFTYRNLGSMMARKCKTDGCELVDNGQVPNKPEIYTFIAA